MRRVIVSEFVSLDGVMEAPDQWHFPYFNDEGRHGRVGCASAAGELARSVPTQHWSGRCSEESQTHGTTSEWISIRDKGADPR
jgi:hypothetical protein